MDEQETTPSIFDDNYVDYLGRDAKPEYLGHVFLSLITVAPFCALVLKMTDSFSWTALILLTVGYNLINAVQTYFSFRKKS